MTTYSHQQIAADKKREELKRDRCWDPQQRWKVIQETITWAEQQSTVRRNDPANRLAEQRRKARPLPK